MMGDDVMRKGPLFGLAAALDVDVPRPNPLGLKPVSVFSAPPPPVDWVCRALHLAPGRPASLSGYAGTGKTNLAACLALAVASDAERAFGLPIDRNGAVVYLDCEVGKRGTWRRFYRLAVGMHLDLGAIGERLQWASYPKLSLAQEGVEELLLQVCAGKVLCVIDSLKRMLRGVDENDARVSDYLEVLARVSEATGCAFVLLQHEGKPPSDGAREARFRGRGSSALQGEWSTHWSISVQGEGATRHVLIDHGKSEHGELLAPLRVRFVDVGEKLEDGMSQGLRLEAIVEGADGPSERPLEMGTAVPAGVVLCIQRQMVDYLAGVGQSNQRDLMTAPVGKKESKLKALRLLVEHGSVVRTEVKTEKGRTVFYSLAGTRGVGSSQSGTYPQEGTYPPDAAFAGGSVPSGGDDDDC